MANFAPKYGTVLCLLLEILHFVFNIYKYIERAMKRECINSASIKRKEDRGNFQQQKKEVGDPN